MSNSLAVPVRVRAFWWIPCPFFSRYPPVSSTLPRFRCDLPAVLVVLVPRETPGLYGKSDLPVRIPTADLFSMRSVESFHFRNAGVVREAALRGWIMNGGSEHDVLVAKALRRSVSPQPCVKGSGFSDRVRRTSAQLRVESPIVPCLGESLRWNKHPPSCELWNQS